MEKLIPLIGKLQEIFYRTKVPFDVDLPQVVVVGGQSSGKSSVLESIVGRDFLPRGTNIVTRRPIQIQLINTPHASREWVEFLHKPGEKFFDFSKVRDEIEQDTDRVCGKNKDISSVHIFLKIFSPKVVDLTLVDLPGTTKVPTGDQPSDIENKIEELCMQYIMPRSAIIMAVCPANNDIANADALKLAKKADPLGERTIGVLTKIDIMDEGTNASDIIRGLVYRLKLGFIPVVCRSQKDIIQGKQIEEALLHEENFFKTHEAYQNICQKAGINYLCKNLNEIIVKQIKKCLPMIRSKITSLLYQRENELKSLHVSKVASSQQITILNVIAKYARAFEEFLEGKFVKDTACELKGASRINYIFYDVYSKAIKDIDPFDALTDDDIKTAIRNSSSLRPNLFVPEIAFEILTKQQIKRLESPSLQCVQLVFEELRRIILEIELPELQRFQNLRKNINEQMQVLLVECLKPTNQMVKNLIILQDSYINTYHPDFMGGGCSVFQLFDPQFEQQQQDQKKKQQKNRLTIEGRDQFDNPIDKDEKNTNSWISQQKLIRQQEQASFSQKGQEERFQHSHARVLEMNKYMQKDVKPIQMPRMTQFKRASDDDPGQSSPRASMEVTIIKNLIVSYFDTVRKTITDMVPKTIMAFLVNKSKNQAQHILVQRIYKDGQHLDELLQEDLETRQLREKCEIMVATLRESLNFLNEVRDFYFEENQ